VTDFTRWDDEARYQIQTDLIRAALGTEGHELDALLAGMEASENEGAVYLCGTRVDNEYCFGSEDLGLLISKYPKGGAKAGVPGYHPGSTETWVILQGRLTLGWLDEGGLRSRTCSRSDVVVLPPGVCHRALDASSRVAAALIVKTNLRHKPGVARCQACTYYPAPAECPLRESWLQEKRELLEATLSRLSKEADREMTKVKAQATTPAVLGQVLRVKSSLRAAAAGAVQAWVHEDGQPELDQIAEEVLQQSGLGPSGPAARQQDPALIGSG
jgi:hypothetical protein